MESKNKILWIHAKWLHDNGYYKEFMDCMKQAKMYDQYTDLRQLEARKKYETKQTIRLS